MIERVLATCAVMRAKNNDGASWNEMDIFQHLQGEVEELEEEIYALDPDSGVAAGEDGVVGEAVDVILCAIDLIHNVHPEFTTDDINEVVNRKLAKWVRLYG